MPFPAPLRCLFIYVMQRRRMTFIMLSVVSKTCWGCSQDIMNTSILAYRVKTKTWFFLSAMLEDTGSLLGSASQIPAEFRCWFLLGQGLVDFSARKVLKVVPRPYNLEQQSPSTVFFWINWKPIGLDRYTFY